MKRIKSALSLSALLVSMAVLTGCDKNKPYDLIIPPEAIHFNTPSGTYNVLVDPAPVYTVQIGTTTSSNVDRTVTVTVTSPSGATAGNEYTIVGGNTVTIPAGEVVGNFSLRANFNDYVAGEIDTLILGLSNGQNAPVGEYQDTMTVYVKGPCFEGDLVLNDFKGTYANTRELWGTSAYGPYITTVSSVNQTSPTTGQITVTNIFDFGWNPIVFDLDWTDPDNLIATLQYQSGIADASTINSAYAGYDVQVNAIPSNPGTFSWCDNFIILRMQPGVVGLGWFNLVYQITLRR